MKKLMVVAIASLALTPVAFATTISDIDLNNFDFDVVNYNTGSAANGLSGDATASGTSNGINWTISPTNLWSGRTTTNGSFQFAGLPVTTDNLHASQNFTITFDKTVKTLLVALSNDNLTDSVNFNLTPSEMIGVSAVDTQINLNNKTGGLVLFKNINSLTITNVNNNGVNDGYDMAFHVVETSEVPVPAAVWLFGSALAGLVGFRKVK